jgi:putative transposase
VKYAWVAEQRGHSVALLCEVVGVSRSGYYAWCGRMPSARRREDERLLQRIRHVHQESREAYGTARTWATLRERGERCGRHRVARLRREAAIRTKRRRRFLRANAPAQRMAAAPRRVEWPFVSPGIDRVWLADITYIPTRQGWLYLAAVLDLYTRRIVGWSMSARVDQTLTSNALHMALERHSPHRGAIHHSDRGSQYTSHAYRETLAAKGLIASMSRTAMPFDNAPMESFFSSLKQELTHHYRFADRDAARAAVFDYIEVFYNRTRLHSALGYRSPQAFADAMVLN